MLLVVESCAITFMSKRTSSAFIFLQVFLHANGTGAKYDTVEVDAESPINADLLLDSTKQNIYVLTERKVLETNSFLSTASN